MDAIRENWLERSQARLGRVTQSLITIYDTELAGGAVRAGDRRLDGEDFAVKAALDQARAALRCDSRPSASASDRLTEYFWAMRSAAPNWSGTSHGTRRGTAVPGRSQH